MSVWYEFLNTFACWLRTKSKIWTGLSLWVWAECPLIVTERGAKDAERAEGVFRSAGERCAAGSGSRGKPHWQISGESGLGRQSALLHNRHLTTLTTRLSHFILLFLQAFKSFRVQYEMKKKQTDPLLQPVNRDGKLSVDQALVKQAWDRVSARVSLLHTSAQHEYFITEPTIINYDN